MKIELRFAAAFAVSTMLLGCGGDSSSPPVQVTPTPSPTPIPTPTPTPTETCNADGTLCWPTAVPSDVAMTSSRPKIVLLTLLDDADYHDLGYYSTDAVTPNIDSIANDGVRLSRFYSAAAICSPSRVSILTGNFPDRYGMQFVWPNVWQNPDTGYYHGMRGLPDYDTTLAQSLSAEGYRTFHIGKWHVGTSRPEYLPDAKGFDRFELTTGKPTGPSLGVLSENGRFRQRITWKPQYEADRIIREIDEALASGEDLFINWWPIEPHNRPDLNQYYIPPTFDAAEFAKSSGRRLNARDRRDRLVAMMYSFDAEFGRIVEHLKARGVYDDSLIIATSDNGGNEKALSSTRVVTGHKNTLGEGGIRVPFAASWPKRFAKRTHSSAAFHSADLYPTIYGLVTGKRAQGPQGRDLSALLLGGKSNASSMFFQRRAEAYRSFDDEKKGDEFVLTEECYKLKLSGGKPELYEVCSDPAETTNLAETETALVRDMTTRLQERRRAGALYWRSSRIVGNRIFESDPRLDIHQDDFSFHALVDTSQLNSSGFYNLYRRGTGMSFSINSGVLVARLFGPITMDRNPIQAGVATSAPLPLDGGTHRVSLVVRGYSSGGASIIIFVDGQPVASLKAPKDPDLQPGPSVFAVKSEKAQAVVGNPGLALSDIEIFVSALEPEELY